MTIQPQLILLQKTLISVEGLGRQLYPDLDLWNTAKPFLEDWMRKRMSYKNILTSMKHHAPYWLEKIPEIPSTISKILQQLEKSSAERQHFSFHKDKHHKAKKQHPWMLPLLSISMITGVISTTYVFDITSLQTWFETHLRSISILSSTVFFGLCGYAFIKSLFRESHL